MGIRHPILGALLFLAGLLAFAIALAQTPTVPGSASAATSTDTVLPAGKIDIVTGDVRVPRHGVCWSETP